MGLNEITLTYSSALVSTIRRLCTYPFMLKCLGYELMAITLRCLGHLVYDEFLDGVKLLGGLRARII